MQIEIKHAATNLSVDLHLDLAPYCQIAKPLYCRLVGPNSISHEGEFREARKILVDQLHQLMGGTHWESIEKLLIAQCKSITSFCKETLPAKNFLKALQAGNEPLAIYAMRNYFVELLKNSMDSMIESYFKDKSDKTHLVMNVALQIMGKHVAITVSDNAGGFPPEYIEHFSQRSQGQKKLWDSRKHKNKKYFFGGCGFGLESLYELLSTGSVGNKESQPTATDRGSMLISSDEIGAKIVVTSLLQPPSPSLEPPRKKRRLRLNDSQKGLADVQSHLFLAPPPCRAKKQPLEAPILIPAENSLEDNFTSSH